MVALDAMSKAADIRVIQAELNDMMGVCLKFTGNVSSIQAALDAGQALAATLHVQAIVAAIPAPAHGLDRAAMAKKEFSPLIEQDVVTEPIEDPKMAEQNAYAIGFIETQGFTAVIAAVDAAVKAANVEVLGREKLGGGYISVIVKGDVAAVKAAVEAGKEQVEGLGKLIATHVIPRPSAAALGLLPK
jgi:microcompartment protein CcmL/EutN